MNSYANNCARFAHCGAALLGCMCSLKRVRWLQLTALILAWSVAGASAQEATIHVDVRNPGHPVSPLLTGVCIEDVNHEIYGGLYSQMLYGESFQEPPNADATAPVSRMWRAFQTGSAKLRASIDKDQPFVGSSSQRIEQAGGDGEVGIENKGLNRWGLSFQQGKLYEGYLWARAAKPTDLYISLETSDGSRRLAESKIAISADQWRRYDFTATPTADESNGRFAISLKSPGSVTLGHTFLQPGAWGRFKDLPVLRDVVEGLIRQGVSVMRYGGSMVNARAYRWKQMIGPSDRRPPYKGTWYPYSSNGWGIIDFLNLCEAANFVGVPDFNANESPQDMSDFVEYVNGPADSPWGRRRAADGHPAPYHLKYLEIGNEERIDDLYAQKFAAMAEAIWAKDPSIIPVVGDFSYSRPISDPMRIDGAAAKITTLAGQQSILKFAKSKDQEVWFDVHIGTEGPGAGRDLDALPTYIDALQKLADGAKHRVVVFEFNAGHHAQRRALANALAIGRIERDGRIPIATSANGLQPDGQNNNGWDQGLLFFNPSKTWLQPPGYVTQMIAQSRLPLNVPAEVTGSPLLDVTAERSPDGKMLVLRIVNIGDAPVPATVILDGFATTESSAKVITLAAPLSATNTADQPDAVVPKETQLPLKHGEPLSCTFPPYSFTVVLLPSGTPSKQGG